MGDPRVTAYARLLVERSVDVQPGWQVVVQSSPLARPLVEEVLRLIGERGAYVLPQISYETMSAAWVKAAPAALLGELSPIQRYTWEHADALITIMAPENTRDGASIPPERLGLLGKASGLRVGRILSLDLRWVGCQFPTPALAQDAGMALSDYEDFLYGACLLDWDAEGQRMRRLADRFDAAQTVRLVGAGTDLTLSLAGRTAMVDDGHLNMPGGEFFYSPVEDSAEGVVSFSEFPAIYNNNEVEGVRLVFEGGKVVEATARRNEDFLRAVLDTDAGARVLGELGIGCNPGIRQHMRNVLFDEKMFGTIHLALGRGFEMIGGTNRSAVHWDMVKDLRQDGRIYCDDQLVQERGSWLF